MGTSITQCDANFELDAKHFDAALAAIKACPHGPSYTIQGESVRDASTLLEALERWCWHATVSDSGNIVDIRLEGENANNDEFLFQAIAPFVKDGSYIELQYVGYGYDRFRYSFKDGKMLTLTPRIIWG